MTNKVGNLKSMDIYLNIDNIDLTLTNRDMIMIHTLRDLDRFLMQRHIQYAIQSNLKQHVHDIGIRYVGKIVVY